MKKKFLLSKVCLMALCLVFCSLPIYAATDNVPKTINLQGRYTKSYGDPVANENITVHYQFSENGSSWGTDNTVNTKTDSEGLYNLNLPVTLSPNTKYFRVAINATPSGDGYLLASSPYSFYSSTATYALSLDPVNGDKLVNENFKSDITYNISVANAVLATTANNALKVSTETASGKNGYVWGINNDGTQTWVKPGDIQIRAATNQNVGGILLGSDTGLVMKPDNKTLEINSGAGLLINNSNKLDLDFGNIESTNITKSVTGKAIYDELAKKQDTLTQGNGINIDTNNVISAVVKSDKGLDVDSDGLSVKIGSKKGLDVDSNGLLVSVDGSTIEIDSNGKLKVKDSTFQQKLTQGNGINIDTNNVISAVVESNKGLDINSNGLSVKIGSKKGLDVDSNGLLVSVDGSTIEIDSNGKLKVKDSTFQQKLTQGNGINIDTNNVISAVVESNKGLDINSNGLSVKIGSKKGLDVDSNGLLVSVDGSTIEIDSNGKLKVKDSTFQPKLTKGNGINIADNVISAVVESNKGLDVNSNGLSVKLESKKGLDVNSNGLFVSVDGSTIEIDSNGKLKVKDSTFQPKLTKGNGIDIDSNTISVKLSDLVDNTTIFVNNDGKLSTTNSGGADLAEIYQSSEKLVPGDVVSIDTTKDNAIVKTKVPEDTLVAGVISTEPGVLMNQKEKGYKLALVGKVPTKVCNEGGAVKRGDLLVSASIPGYAKKAGDNPKVGTVIGKALENLDSQKGTILVLVNLQ